MVWGESMLERLRKIKGQDRQMLLNMAGVFGIKGAALLISIALFPAYLRFFHNQVALGVWYTLLSASNWAVLFDLGLGHGLRNKLPAMLIAGDRQEMRRCISSTYILMSSVALAIAILGLASIPYLDWNALFNVNTALVERQTLISCVQIMFGGMMLQSVLKIVCSILYAMQRAALVNALALLSNAAVLILLRLLPSRSIGENLSTLSIINLLASNLPYLLCTIFVFAVPLRGVCPRFRDFSRKHARNLLDIGLSLFWLQVVFMIISSTNEVLISHLGSPQDVVTYQAYFKIFHTVATVASALLAPTWSAVTRAQAQGQTLWIRKVYRLSLMGALLCFCGMLCIIPFLQRLMDLWLGPELMTVNTGYALVFALSSAVFILHHVNTSIGNGLSYFRLQMLWMTFAAAAFIPLSFLLVRLTGSWIGVVIANTLSVLPYEILAPVFTLRKIKEVQRATQN